MKPETDPHRVRNAGILLFDYLCRQTGSSNHGWRGRSKSENLFWPDFIRFASEQLVLTATAGAAGDPNCRLQPPDDVIAFLRAIEKSNRQRNLWLLRELQAANCALRQAGIDALVLKGGAFLAKNPTSAAGWRFFGDLDFLVSKDNLDRAVSVFKELGYLETQTEYHPHHHRHYPFLMHPEGITGVDLHTRLAGLDQTVLLDPELFFDRAVPVPSEKGDIPVPSATDRLTHLIVNAQILDYRYRRRLFRLRDILDFAELFDEGSVNFSEIGARFDRYGDRQPFTAYLAMVDNVLGWDWCRADIDHVAMRWVKEVEKVMRNPRRARLHILKHWFQMAAEQLTDPKARQFLIERIRDPRQRKEFLLRRTLYWRVFQR